MNTNNNDTLTRRDKLMLEGYKALNVWNCQQSQDHLTFDKVFMPVVVGAPILALAQRDDDKTELGLLILAGGLGLLIFWFFRNLRSRMRMYETFKLFSAIEVELKFEVQQRMRDAIDKSRLPRDFTLKIWFFAAAVLLYLVSICMMLH